MQCLVTLTGQQPDDVLRPPIQYANESPLARLAAVRIASVIRQKAKQFGFLEADRAGVRTREGQAPLEPCNMWDEYQAYMLKALMEDEDPLVRAECLKAVSLDGASLEFLVAKTLDCDPLVRLEAYRKLTAECD